MELEEGLVDVDLTANPAQGSQPVEAVPAPSAPVEVLQPITIQIAGPSATTVPPPSTPPSPPPPPATEHLSSPDTQPEQGRLQNVALNNTPMVSSMPIVFTTDNAPSIVKALQSRAWTRVPCFCHVTALAVKAANSDATLSKWRSHVTKIVLHFKSSTQSKDKLADEQKAAGKAPKMLVQEGATRWTSTFGMLQRFNELYNFVVAVAAKHRLQAVNDNLPKNASEEAMMKSVINIYLNFLQPFKFASLVAQGSTYPTLPYVARFLLPIIFRVAGNMLQQRLSDSLLEGSIK